MKLRVFACLIALGVGTTTSGQTGPIEVGDPLGAVSESGVATQMSSNVKVYGSLRFAESCTFDPDRNLILAMNAGVAQDVLENDGFVSLINPDGSVHTAKWIGVSPGQPDPQPSSGQRDPERCALHGGWNRPALIRP